MQDIVNVLLPFFFFFIISHDRINFLSINSSSEVVIEHADTHVLVILYISIHEISEFKEGT